VKFSFRSAYTEPCKS